MDSQTQFTDTDVEAFVFNESLIRNLGGRSSGTVIFSRSTAPGSDITVQRNFPIGTQPDESSGETVVFVTTESKTMFAASASSFFNLNTERYELEVAVQAVVAGSTGTVASNRLNRPLRPLANFEQVFNRNATSVALDRETNAELLDRYKIAIIGNQFATRGGLAFNVLAQFPDASDILVVTAGDPLIVRAGTDSGAVDVFVLGSQSTSRSDSQEFIGENQLIVLNNQPVLAVTNITGFTLDTDYEFVKDTSGNAGSTRAQDGIRFFNNALAAPTIGDTIGIDYTQDILIQNIQNFLVNDDNDVGGQDTLARKATQVNITLSAVLTISAGTFATVQTAVTNAIINFINNLGLGENVERSDIQQVVRAISGVDNFVFSILDEVGGTGNSDVTIEKSEFARIASADITILAS